MPAINASDPRILRDGIKPGEIHLHESPKNDHHLDWLTSVQTRQPNAAPAEIHRAQIELSFWVALCGGCFHPFEGERLIERNAAARSIELVGALGVNDAIASAIPVATWTTSRESLLKSRSDFVQCV